MPRTNRQIILVSSPSGMVRQSDLVMDFADRYRVAMKELGGWVQSDQLCWRETIVPGLANAPKAFIGLLEGANIGKQLVQVSEL